MDNTYIVRIPIKCSTVKCIVEKSMTVMAFVILAFFGSIIGFIAGVSIWCIMHPLLFEWYQIFAAQSIIALLVLMGVVWVGLSVQFKCIPEGEQ